MNKFACCHYWCRLPHVEVCRNLTAMLVNDSGGHISLLKLPICKLLNFAKFQRAEMTAKHNSIGCMLGCNLMLKGVENMKNELRVKN